MCRRCRCRPTKRTVPPLHREAEAAAMLRGCVRRPRWALEAIAQGSHFPSGSCKERARAPWLRFPGFSSIRPRNDRGSPGQGFPRAAGSQDLDACTYPDRSENTVLVMFPGIETGLRSARGVREMKIGIVAERDCVIGARGETRVGRHNRRCSRRARSKWRARRCPIWRSVTRRESAAGPRASRRARRLSREHGVSAVH